MLEIRNISARLGGRFSTSDINLKVSAGELVAIIGPNGAGKSTLLKLVSGEVSANAGNVLIGGKPRIGWSRRDLARVCAVMGQAPSLAFDFTVKELVELGRAPHRGTDAAHMDKAIADHAIDFAGLNGFQERAVPSLSGGERQRAFFAKALAQLMSAPGELPGAGTLLLLDEPTSALDLAQQSRVLGAARQIAHAGGAILCVLHDLNLAAAFADRICVLVDGRAVATGSPSDILTEDALEAWYGCKVNVQPSTDGLRKVVTLSA
jgi:iron complex transport system ATP-binding protein